MGNLSRPMVPGVILIEKQRAFVTVVGFLLPGSFNCPGTITGGVKCTITLNKPPKLSLQLMWSIRPHVLQFVYTKRRINKSFSVPYRGPLFG